MHWRRWKRRGLYWYSRYPEFYMPMCRKCHNRRDGAAHAKELAEYRRWKHSQNQAAS